MRLIDADKAIEILNENQVEGDELYKGLGRAKSVLMEQPTVEYTPVVNGHWTSFGEYVECSVCERLVPNLLYRYCPYCGTKMG